ncbi:Endonuclease/exonuclease/phosphatase [Dichotomopilus funicola]|uniref:Endonuclease/exonuclease/phosphatase n=1 Tax=Dichotomopilus funicola TaxID=1934379 RepID=A0AAN6V1S1_9PEZI|nr:Endonuclease/exonuclease/phosphatase [Dichotomopilus funicola]
MGLLSRLRTQLVSWWQDIPLPTDIAANFQMWHEFDGTQERWRTVRTTAPETSITPGAPNNEDTRPTVEQPSYNLVTWNVDYSSSHPAQRLTAILSHLFALSPAIDIIFLQEVSREALSSLLSNLEIRRDWFLSDADGILPAGQSFLTITLLSKARFRETIGLSPVWRVPYTSRFGRDALCCDIFAPMASDAPGPTRIRLINVHLDSLPIQPSLRPQQVSASAALLRCAGRGVMAGDFNPVLPADADVVEHNGLIDAWAALRPNDEGFTWGVRGDEPFPPNRMDKVAIFGVKVEDIGVLTPAFVENTGRVREHEDSDSVVWSDHSGLKCSFKLVES